jgi:hypothetical protein
MTREALSAAQTRQNHPAAVHTPDTPGSSIQRQPEVDTGSRKRRRRSTVETPAFLAFMGRILRAASRRVANADEIEFGMLVDLGRNYEDVLQGAVDGLRARHVSWEVIGHAAGMTKQAAQKRWGRS